MTIVLALGGNALLRRGEPLDAETQRSNARRAGAAVAEVARRHRVVVTHGNGPQVGLLALQSAALHPARPDPLDLLGAESEGMIGYVLEQELHSRLPGASVATVLTQTVVDPDDSAFDRPTKFVGPQYDEPAAAAVAAERGWSFARDGERLRRVVSSPRPQRILELDAIATLVEAGTLVIAAGGGGVPVCQRPDGTLRGVEAVVDKDLASGLLARQLGADLLVLLTDVAAVYRDWCTPRRSAIREAAPEELRRERFPAGSMGPKVEAACLFAEAGGRAVIGALEEAAALVRGEAGTLVRPSSAA
ncbi:MAG: carbamate kinase [Gammaproteobacteria bacterium]|nr:carbamate kinase [Gammaproteobacteria bacterium]NIR98234.1 carbamate kinase [Gammaproteobacteria bacterium]NIT63905.1 carbamate kinase [Gammaproteobacteria bacterium]NIV20909.1 carbamate kinase [Gammaproteobacteria bacterium]NIY32485.1 carbamate kinase [Gammaproteobacteria bacterium]